MPLMRSSFTMSAIRFDDRIARLLERNLADDDPETILAVLFNARPRSNRDRAASGDDSRGESLRGSR